MIKVEKQVHTSPALVNSGLSSRSRPPDRVFVFIHVCTIRVFTGYLKPIISVDLRPVPAHILARVASLL